MDNSKFLLSAVFLAAFTQSVLAQDESAAQDSSSAASSADASSTIEEASSSTSASSASRTSSASSTSSASETATTETSATSSVSSSVVTSSTTSSATTSNSLPTLTNTAAIPSYPAASVPPTSEAPFMHRSSAPDGTVFIAVGAILGTFALAVLLWRGIVACMLHRSVERAARAQALSNDKSAYPIPPAAPFYKYTDHDSSPSLAARNPEGSAAANGRGVRRTTRGPIPSGTPSMTNLFYSPTAAPSAGLNANRESRFLPAGFYASSNSPAPPVGFAQGSTSVGQSISMSNLHPDARNYSRSNLVAEPSPENSPHFAPQRRNMSSSTLNLNRPSSVRAPSAYLDDLLDENPHMFPSQQAPGQSPRQGNMSPGQNRF
ncbi:hypothetical protein BROUX41_005572 [Berkeleyomyces rouxiae]|uniref:uncharacterized protein n=1 Tax=Berkeleyomyces rouxiae TaxID=2035830 RepID=UPI003B7AD1C6